MGLLALSAAGGHVVYPALLWLATAGRRRDPPGDPRDWPGVSLVVSAYREEPVIGRKVDEALEAGRRYPGRTEVVVVADDEPTAAAARGRGARVLSSGHRRGKAPAVNAGVAAASHPVIVLTDANNRIGPDALPALVRHLEDPAIGAAAGVEIEDDAGGETLYASFENWLKWREHLLGTTVGVAGELVAIRRDAWAPLPPDVMVDDLWIALDLAERGLRVAYERAARSVEPATAGRDRWERRTRIVAGTLDVVWRKRHLLRRGGVVPFEVVGHKLWRSTAGPFSHLALLLLALGSCRRSRLARLFVGGHAAAGVLAVRAQRGRRLPPALALPAEVLYLQVVAVGGVVRALRCPPTSAWPKGSRRATG